MFEISFIFIFCVLRLFQFGSPFFILVVYEVMWHTCIKMIICYNLVYLELDESLF